MLFILIYLCFQILKGKNAYTVKWMTTYRLLVTILFKHTFQILLYLSTRDLYRISTPVPSCQLSFKLHPTLLKSTVNTVVLDSIRIYILKKIWDGQHCICSIKGDVELNNCNINYIDFCLSSQIYILILILKTNWLIHIQNLITLHRT